MVDMKNEQIEEIVVNGTDVEKLSFLDEYHTTLLESYGVTYYQSLNQVLLLQIQGMVMGGLNAKIA